ncbi:predicted protein [Nematostella vectensis]|uniref:Protein rolling stone n=1 Tax=Nematostella vectensis TaxID=45351 RepID=A7S053_NEMVE|nr:predicted protein [Nematostella vectensis]|eukprot:XP_001634967.1 predicted protein [Nematostella vectensis]
MFEVLHPDNLKLRFPLVSAFTTSPWLPLCAFAMYRLVIGIYCLAWMMFVETDEGYKWFLYINHWNFLALSLYFILAGVLSIMFIISPEGQGYQAAGEWGDRWEPYIVGLSDDVREKKSGWTIPIENSLIHDDNHIDRLSFPHKCLWVVFTVATVGSIQSSLVYWCILRENTDVNGYNVTFFIVNSIFVVIELLLSNMPVVPLHIAYAHAFQSTYILSTVVYWASGGTSIEGKDYIYNGMDYSERPAMAVLTAFLSLLLFQPLAQLMCYLLCKLRVCMILKYLYE